jgi:hypothetical protein
MFSITTVIEMTQEEKDYLMQATRDLSHLKKLTEELNRILTGEPGNPGLIKRIENAEYKRELQIQRDQELKDSMSRDYDNLKSYIFEYFETIDERLYNKFKELDEKNDGRFKKMFEFQGEMSEFKRRIDIYISLMTGKATWTFLFKAAGFLVGTGGLMYIVWRFGYEYILRLLKL